ncbi:glutaredoxin domain-containing cysteine-rich protein 2 [Hemicordylus capensis]|uniref:glutaredoxin domain-containing cysteine-rich protein 2 n=1 Tax=Hemicordylus capensis TaxID=884348 RepID=UPI002303A94D|nr:glutaredoxin domain-containing cysteine-rich protein 2 [Hemicordylus capensis]
MDELQKKLSQRHEARPRKVRFKISSAYSGRVLKQVYEDGQELEIPPEEYPHRLRHRSFEPRDHLFGIGEAPESRFCPPAKLNAQRISVFREGSKYTLTSSPSLLNDYQENDSRMVSAHPPILDFGKIIIYTSNLKIIRTPMNKKELVRKIMQNEGIDDLPFMHHEGRGNSSNQSDGNMKDTENEPAPDQNTQEGDDENSCSQCKGSGSAPCSVCHGSKFSMLANRFKESYRALRCPACNENGLQPCQTCVP